MAEYYSCSEMDSDWPNRVVIQRETLKQVCQAHPDQMAPVALCSWYPAHCARIYNSTIPNGTRILKSVLIIIFTLCLGTLSLVQCLSDDTVFWQTNSLVCECGSFTRRLMSNKMSLSMNFSDQYHVTGDVVIEGGFNHVLPTRFLDLVLDVSAMYSAWCLFVSWKVMAVTVVNITPLLPLTGDGPKLFAMFAFFFVDLQEELLKLTPWGFVFVLAYECQRGLTNAQLCFVFTFHFLILFINLYDYFTFSFFWGYYLHCVWNMWIRLYCIKNPIIGFDHAFGRFWFVTFSGLDKFMKRHPEYSEDADTRGTRGKFWERDYEGDSDSDDDVDDSFSSELKPLPPRVDVKRSQWIKEKASLPTAVAVVQKQEKKKRMLFEVGEYPVTPIINSFGRRRVAFVAF